MAAYPQFGGTNGVTELDIGQRGGTRATAGTASWVGRMRQVAADAVITQQPIPQSAMGFVDVQGPKGPKWLWAGRLRTVTTIMIQTIRSELELHLHGHAVNTTTGAWVAFNEAEVKPTVLKNSFGETITSRAKLVLYNLGETTRISGGSYSFSVPLLLHFMVI